MNDQCSMWNIDYWCCNTRGATVMNYRIYEGTLIVLLRTHTVFFPISRFLVFLFSFQTFHFSNYLKSLFTFSAFSFFRTERIKFSSNGGIFFQSRNSAKQPTQDNFVNDCLGKPNLIFLTLTMEVWRQTMRNIWELFWLLSATLFRRIT